MITLSRRQIVLLALPLIGVLALAGSRLARTGTAAAPAAVAPVVVSSPTGGTAASRASLYVHVVGAVHRAGLYRLRDGTRIADALRRAGGVTRRADVALVNLAAPLVDGMQVLVPTKPDVAAASAAGAAQATGLPTVVSLASATVEQLDELPGIGPVTAQRIVDWRLSHGPFSSVDDLDQVPGMGPARVEQLRDLVTP